MPKLGDSQQLLERSDQLAVLADALGAVGSRAGGRLVLLEGEAGIGKTSLAREFAAGLRAPGRVLWGGCEALTTPAPLAPLLDVAEQTGGELATLLAGEATPHEVCNVLIRELNRRDPTVLVLEDIHWADEATLDVLRLLGRRLDRVQALIVATYRYEQLDRAHPVRLLLGDLAATPGVERLALEPLSPSAVSELAAAQGVDGVDLHRKTNGNPFFVTEVLEVGGQEVPSTVRDAVLARAAGLSVPASEVLEAVAVSPPDLDVSLLEALVGESASALAECLESGMLVSTADRVSFRHELARLAFEESLAPDRRRALHRAALEGLTASPGGPELDRLVHHAEAAGDVEATLRFAPDAAARAAAMGAHREAAAHYERAAHFAELLPIRTRAELLERRSFECYLSGEFDEAISAQRAALACYRELGDRLREGDSLRSLGRLLGFGGRTHESAEACRQAVAVLEALEPGRELALAYASLAQRCMNWEDSDAARDWSTRALELSESLSDTETAVYALVTLGSSQFRTDASAGIETLERSLEMARSAGLEDHVGRTFVALAMLPMRTRSFALVERHLEEGLEYCSDRGLDYWWLFLTACRARCELDQGRWEDAAASAGAVAEDPRAWPIPRVYALTVLGLARVRRGDAGGRVLLDEALAFAGPTGELQQIAPAAVARAEAAWLAQSPEEVVAGTQPALDLALRTDSTWEAGDLARWRRRCGVVDEIPGLREPHASELADDWPRAATLWSELGCPYEAALALAETGDEEAGRRALAELQSLGAEPAAAVVVRRLRDRGVRGLPRGPRASTRENPAGLTARELEVLTLVAEGLRNAEIAERLVVSEKTVDHHVSAVLRKLDVRTRAEATARAVKLGITAKDG
jgi:DNA-binding CsgD family transcriptional regulator/tetratricopeptide (TPR) repeat protein